MTRVDPDQGSTSMILRPRPGWEELRAFLSGEGDGNSGGGAGGGKPRQIKYDIYVCTAAERRYALEVWRLLDPGGLLIPPEKREERIINVDVRCETTLLGGAVP